DGYGLDPIYMPIDMQPQDIVLTLNNLLKKTRLIKIMEDILGKLERGWGHPVDIEFTALIEKDNTIRVNLLQCRPLRTPNATELTIMLPQNIEAGNVLFKSNRTLSGGIIDSIRYIVYIDPWKYGDISSLSIKKSLGRVMGKLNEVFRSSKDKVIAIGPGRWGSNNIDLGVNVSYADIDNVKVLVEVSRAEAGHEPELSFGTHFFQDLIEAEIIYLPVFSEQSSAEFNRQFFNDSPNALGDLLPGLTDFSDYIRVIDVPGAYQGACAHVAADPQTRTAICYIK
ncbi:MAG: PEP/pyruvate-binding domain-containing protein, partial [Dehalococcoidales bacterium]|nr:PEP/pyruvate-binding domain-containing protein [Dehalococcoidales bacterium]